MSKPKESSTSQSEEQLIWLVILVSVSAMGAQVAVAAYLA